MKLEELLEGDVVQFRKARPSKQNSISNDHSTSSRKDYYNSQRDSVIIPLIQQCMTLARDKFDMNLQELWFLLDDDVHSEKKLTPLLKQRIEQVLSKPVTKTVEAWDDLKRKHYEEMNEKGPFFEKDRGGAQYLAIDHIHKILKK